VERLSRSPGVGSGAAGDPVWLEEDDEVTETIDLTPPPSTSTSTFAFAPAPQMSMLERLQQQQQQSNTPVVARKELRQRRDTDAVRAAAAIWRGGEWARGSSGRVSRLWRGTAGSGRVTQTSSTGSLLGVAPGCRSRDLSRLRVCAGGGGARGRRRGRARGEAATPSTGRPRDHGDRRRDVGGGERQPQVVRQGGLVPSKPPLVVAI
jgi:hypothetical protein